MNPPAQTYGITLDKSGTHDFGMVNPSYAPLTPLSVTVTNTGNQSTGELTVELSGANAANFTRSAATISSIATGAEGTFTVVPQTGLGVGTYNATVTVSGANSISAAFDVSFTVTALPVYTVSITPPGNGNNVSANHTSVTEGTNVTLTAEPATGYDFTSFTFSGSKSGTVTASPHTFAMPAGAVTVTSVFTIKTFTVTLDRQSGSGGTASVVATYGQAMPTATAPTRAGYTFGGYWTETNGGGTQYYSAAMASLQSYTLLEGITLYAKWTKTIDIEDFSIASIDTYGVTETTKGTGEDLQGYLNTIKATPGNYVVTITGNPTAFNSQVVMETANVKISLRGSGTISTTITSIVGMMNGELIIRGPTLQGFAGSATHSLVIASGNSARHTLREGTITGHSNNGVLVMNSATFTMTGGTISNNAAGDGYTSSSGGGVAVFDNGNFQMSGGTISGNTANTGGGVYVSGNGTFTKNGGTIYGDTNNIHESGSTENTASGTSGAGHAVFYNNDGKYRDATLGESNNISTGDLTVGWEN
ncbi:hypothetical protein FACS189487_06820 [Campylobacterota bacterium]|nr:hypothetical protein FACS189487_06820 [Campylobacterota bacterium]